MSARDMWRWLVFSLTGRVPGQGVQPVERRVVAPEEAEALGLTADVRRMRGDDYEATTGHAITCGAGFGAGCQCDTVSVPRDALRRLVDVAQYVAASEPYPDPVAAIRALGALDDAGLLDQFREDGNG